jgi:hypothetical protein
MPKAMLVSNDRGGEDLQLIICPGDAASEGKKRQDKQQSEI